MMHCLTLHCATSQKVAGSFPDVVIGIFHCLDPSGHTMALGSVQPLTEMRTRNISWGINGCNVPTVYKSWKPPPPGTLNACPGLYTNSFTASHSRFLSNIWQMQKIWLLVYVLCQYPHWWSTAISSAYGINLDRRMLDRILNVVDKSDLPW
jgi:hypothetical protein